MNFPESNDCNGIRRDVIQSENSAKANLFGLVNGIS